MGEPNVEIDVIFVGQTGVGKSSLINMILPVDAEKARVSSDAIPCTTHTTSYSTSLDAGLRCQLWDTRGLDEAVGAGFMSKLVDRIRRLANQQARELKEDLRGRIKVAKPILLWCIDAAKVDVPIHWQQFQKVYVEYCEKIPVPAIVITRGPPKTGWEQRCTDQLRQLNLGVDVPFLMVRKYKNPSSPAGTPDYGDDTEALKDLISGLIKRYLINPP